MTLSDLKPGDRAKILKFQDAPHAYRQRLMTMGLTPQAEIRVIRRAPMGDPIEIEVRGSLLSLRQAEAACLQLERIA